MTFKRSIRIAVVCALAGAATLIVAGSTSADPPPRHDFMVATLAIPVTPATNTDDTVIRFQTAHGRSAEIDSVSTATLNCDGCSAHASTVHVVYAPRPRAVVADNVATAWASDCAGCSGWAVSLQIVIARSAGTVTAANRALAFTAGCTQCTIHAAAVQIVVIAASERQLAPRQMDSVQALYDQLVDALGSAPSPASSPASSPTRAGAAVPQAAPNRATTTVTATAQHIQDMVAAGLHASSATHAVVVR